MLVALVATLLTPAILITPELLEELGLELLVSGKGDYDLSATITSLHLSKHKPPEQLVVIVGGSTTRDAINTRLLDEELSELNLDKLKVYNLTTTLQSLWHTAAFLDQIPNGSHGIAILGVQPGVFCAEVSSIRKSHADKRFGVRSSFYDAEIERLGITAAPRVGVYLYDNLEFFLPRISIAARNYFSATAPIIDDEHRISRSSLKGEEWLERGRFVAGKFSSYEDRASIAQSFLSRMIARLRERTRVTPILVEAPVNPKFVNDFNQTDRYRAHENWVERFASEQGIQYLNLNDEIQMQNDYFYDWGHLNHIPTMKRTSQLVAEAVAGTIVNK